MNAAPKIPAGSAIAPTPTSAITEASVFPNEVTG
jgi:hypothetical protein